MKKYSLLLVALLGVMCWSCKKDDKSSSAAPITLSAPAADASIDLSDGQDVTFSWTGVSGGAKVELSKSVDLANSQSFTATGGSLTVTAAELNAKLVALGVAPGVSEKIYWSVTPDQKGFLPDARALNVKSLPLAVSEELTAPELNAVIALDWKNPTTPVEFAWGGNAASYELVFSKDQAFTQPKSVTVSANTKTFTHNELQTLLIEDATLGLKKYLDNYVYWNVKVGGNFISATPGLFTLSGNKSFTDVRTNAVKGIETITYEVSIITNLDGTKTIWLAEDLRTAIFADGSNYLLSKADGDGPEHADAWAAHPYVDYSLCPSKTGELTDISGTPIPQAVQDRVGFYYNLGGDAMPNYIGKIIPAGWRLPFFEDFENLYAAAKAAPGGNQFVVLKDPACYQEGTYPDNREHYNAWHMNMVENGMWVWNCWKFQYDATLWYLYEGSVTHPNSGYKNVTMFWGEGVLANTPNNGAVPIRLIYTGDDE